MIVPLILCGGSGTRLWPASRDHRPKQFLRLLGPFSTFQETVRRVCDRELFEFPVIVANRSHHSLIATQLAEIEAQGEIILEPEARDSGPAILAGTLFIARRFGLDATVLALASDHMIRDVAGFQAACRNALPAAQKGHIVTFGIMPHRPATGYGYIDAGDEIEPGVRAVARFVEKPDLTTAAQYVRNGFLWNSGNFLFQAAALIDAYRENDPATVEALIGAVIDAKATGNEHALDPAFFARATKLSFDHAVMEKTSRAAVLPAPFDWSDVGSWAAVREISPRDEAGNAAKGPAVFVEANDNVVASDGPLIAMVGVDDLAVVVADDCVLVARRDDEFGIRLLVKELERSHANLAQQHSRHIANLQGSTSPNGHAVTRIDLAPGGRLSLKGVRDQARHWLIINGAASIMIGGEVRHLERYDSIQLPRETDCMLQNSGSGPLEILEIQLTSQQ